MGCVCSCFASVFLWTGELLENLFLAIGEISSILIRGLFAVLVGLCDVLASISCCWRVPYDERPDRQTYSYTVSTFAKPLSQSRGPSILTKEGRLQRAKVRQEKSAAEKERQLNIQQEKHEKQLRAQEEKDVKDKEKSEKKKAEVEEKLRAKEESLRIKKEGAAEKKVVDTPATEKTSA